MTPVSTPYVESLIIPACNSAIASFFAVVIGLSTFLYSDNFVCIRHQLME
jgi:hypothetical protein